MNINLITANMKTLNFLLPKDILNEFTLSNEEMIHVRGGESDILIKTTIPPVKL